MDIGRFQANITNLINAGGLKGKGVEAEKIKKENGLTAQTGPKADTVEINFARLADVQNNPSDNADVAKIASEVSEMSMPEAKAAFQNPEIFNKLVAAGVLE